MELIDPLYSDEQMAELYRAISDALRQVRLLGLRKENDIMGEIYTRLRQDLSQRGWPIFDAHRLKNVQSRSRRQWQFIERMVNRMRQEIEKFDPQEGLARLRLQLAGLNASVTEIENVNHRTEAVMKGVEQVHDTLNPPQGEAIVALASLQDRP